MDSVVYSEFQTDLKKRFPEVFEDESSDPYEYATKITFADVLADEALLGEYALQRAHDFWVSIPFHIHVSWPRNARTEGHDYFQNKKWLIGKGKMPKKEDLLRYRKEKLETIDKISVPKVLKEEREVWVYNFPYRELTTITPELCEETTKILFEDEWQDKLEKFKDRSWEISQRKKKELAKAREKCVVTLCAILDQTIRNSPDNEMIHRDFLNMTVVQAKKKLIGFMKRPKLLHEDYKSYQLHLAQVLADEKLLDAFLFFHTNECLRPLLWEVKVCFPVKPLLDKDKREMLMRRNRERSMS